MKNPTESIYWKTLTEDYKNTNIESISDLFKDKNRFKDFSINIDNQFLFDFSKNKINSSTLKHLISFAEEMNLKSEIEKMFHGEKINKTENRAVLHTALRDFSDTSILVDNKDVKPDIKKELQKMEKFCNKFSSEEFQYIVNIGIGGSDLGGRMTCEALKDFSINKNLEIYFVSNVDFKEIKDVLSKIDVEKTLFIISSKSFTTQEAMANAKYAKNYFISKIKNKNISKNFVAVSTNTPLVIKFGIKEENIFTFWDWVGGRYSIWSSIGLPLCLYIGFENYIKFLKGANNIDTHFRNKDFNKNIPVIMGLISIWYNNFYNADTTAIISYSHRLNKLVPYLQQCIMESNGKGISRKGEEINYQTGSIVWGGVGTDVQHSFFQHLHQGTKFIPVDFITFIDDFKSNKLLLSNYLAQTQSLAFGEENKDNLHKNFKGDNPSNSMIFKELNPYTLGMLISIYEHKTFVEGIFWNIFSFDQWGVELGKINSQKILKKFEGENANFDASTEGIINFINQD